MKSSNENVKCQTNIKKQNVQSKKLSNNLKININEITEQLKRRGYVKRQIIMKMLILATKSMSNEPNMIKIQSPVTVVGDIHGQFYDLLNIFQTFHTPQSKKYLFLGDYVDRGCFCIEVMTLLIAYKICYNQNIYMLRGNHQSRILGANFNFKQQCVKKYDAQIYQFFMEFFDTLPLCCIIDKSYFAVHAGISPTFNLSTIQTLNRFNQVPNEGTICDLLWSDPTDEEQSQWKSNFMRSCSVFYSPIHSQKFIHQNNLKMIIRAHQVQKQGFKYQISEKKYRNNLVLTIFSAPNYCDTYKNEGAILLIDKNGIKIKQFHCVKHPIVLAKYLNTIQWSLPLLANNVGNLVMAILKNRTKKRTILVDQAIIKKKIQEVQKIELINNIIARKAEQNSNIFKVLQRNEETNNIQVNAQAALALFLNRKNTDQSQKMPFMFGPKIHLTSKLTKKSFDCSDEEPNTEKQNQLQ